MAADGAASRDELARQAEKHLRQGRTDLAIELYDRLAQLAPTDWNTVKQLADLHERAGQREAAAGRFLQCADHHFAEGFHAKAAALYRKVLKLEPSSEHALWQLAEVSLALKLKADARLALGQVLALRRRRGDDEGAEAAARRLAELEPDDPRHRSLAPAVPTPAAAPSPEEVTDRLREVAREADARGDADGAVRAWLAVLQRDPADRVLRGRLVAACLDRQDVETARGLVEPLEGDAAEVVAWRFELAVLGGRGDLAKALATRIVPTEPGDPERVHEVREALRMRNPALADAWCTRVVDALAQQGREADAAAIIESADARHPLPVECHLRWVELCVDAGLDGLDRAQTALASAYLRAGQPDLARAVADDLLIRRPDLESVRALVFSIHEACGEPHPERSVQELLEPAAHQAVEADPDEPWVATAEPTSDPDPWETAPPVFEAAPASMPPPAALPPLVAASPGAPSEGPPPLVSAAGNADAAPPVAAFDWGALLGREATPVAPPPAPAPPAPPAAPAPPAPPAAAAAPAPPPVADPLVAEAAGLAVPAPFPTSGFESVADDPQLELLAAFAAGPPDADEIDLTDLLEELRQQKGPTLPAPMPAPDAPADDPAAPAGAADGGDVVADAASDAREAAPGMLAAQQVAAGRVFAAAGLAAEAARAFERASKDVRSRFEAAEALAELHRSRGQLTEAVRWYDEATQAPVADNAVRRPVLYDLAETLEAVGQPDRALAVLLDLLSEVEDYRDARARADRLLRVDAGG